MQLRVFFLNILLSIMLVGCSLMPNEMKLAGEIMDSNPDSALHILRQVHSVHSLSDENRALYGILLFQILDKGNKPLQPDSLINFSVYYFERKNDKPLLALAYYYKARVYKRSQQFDKATILYLKTLDLNKTENNYRLLGKIYSDMGDMCTSQKDFNASLEKYNKSIDYLKKAGDTLEALYKVIDIARIYRFKHENNKAKMYYKQSLSQSTDSFLHGLAFQEIGINYYFSKQYDSAKYYLRKSLLYPYKGNNYALRCYNLADLYFDINQFDSAFLYANKALKYPGTFFTQRECYRILTNTEFNLGDLKQMAVYMSKYQDTSDSVRKIENQTKTSVLENLHETTGTVSKSKQFIEILGIIVVLILITGFIIVIGLQKRRKREELELGMAKETIAQNQSVLKQNLIRKIEENKLEKITGQKKLSAKEKEAALLEIYNRCLNLENWNQFSKMMNQTFNNLIQHLETTLPEINQKELIWICLFLLDFTLPDMALVLNFQMSSLYKLKQRVAQKMNLNSTKELEKLLLHLSQKN